MRRSASHVQKDNLFGPGRKFGRATGQRIIRRGGNTVCALTQQCRQCDATQSDMTLLQEVSPGDAVQTFVGRFHFVSVSSRFKSTLLTTVQAASETASGVDSLDC